MTLVITDRSAKYSFIHSYWTFI